MSRRPIGSISELTLVAVLLVLHWYLAMTSSLEKSVAFDEVAHVIGGLAAWELGDTRFNAESGILTQRWTALPASWMEVELPGPDHPARRNANFWAYGSDFLFRSGHDTDTLIFAMRAMNALLSVVLGATVFWLSRSLFGRRAGMLSVALYAWSPTLLAHARLVTADLSAALFFLLASLALAALLDRASPGRLVLAGLAVSGLVLAKMSWVLFVPMAALLIADRLLRAQPWELRLGGESWQARSVAHRLALATGSAAAIGVVVFVAIWAAYGFRFRAAGEADRDGGFIESWEDILGRSALAEPIRVASDHELLPEAFLWGLAYTISTTGGREAFLNGEISHSGWRTFFPYAFLVKTPLPLLALLLLAAVVRPAVRDAPPDDGRRRRLFALWTLLGVYGVTAITSHLNIGHRHLLPIYPVLFVLVGRAARWTEGRPRAGRWGRAAVAALVALFVADSLLIRPHYLSYFNSLAGGPESAYRHLVDSSLDWGQDLPALADAVHRFRDEDPDVPLYCAYFGSADPIYYGIEARWLYSFFPVDTRDPPQPLEPGRYAVSATLLQTLRTDLPGPWTAEAEQEYQDLVAEFEVAWDRVPDRHELDEETLRELRPRFARFQQLRSVRLFHYLQRLAPDDRAGYSILIFDLSREELERADELAAGTATRSGQATGST